MRMVSTFATPTGQGKLPDMISNKRHVQDFIQLLVAKGLTHVIICPGSRNAPFSISLFEHPQIKSYSVVDERSAAFIALGMSQQLQKPVVIICTSGTASLNLAPAIAEAFYQRVPLLVVTADRPPEWIDQGEGQSIRQQSVFANYVKASYQIADDEAHNDLKWYNVRIMDEAMRTCTEDVFGPVHINFPLREKLYGTVEDPQPQIKEVLKTPLRYSLDEGLKKELSDRISSAGKVLILAGQMLPDENLRQQLAKWASLPQVLVMTEAHSNLSHPLFVSTIDRLILSYDEQMQNELIPDLLITFGHNIISRKIKEYLRKGNYDHWHIDHSGEGLDTFKHLNKIIPLKPVDFLESIECTANAGSNYGKAFRLQNDIKRNAAGTFLNDVPFSDLKAFEIIYRRIPVGEHLQMGNSSVVRYILLMDSREDIKHFGNRGVAGIDGCTSTAVGAAFISNHSTTLITGDIAFFYDSNAFWNDMVSKGLKIIVINNGGGGIFRIIEGPKSTPSLEKFFETKHTRTTAPFAAMFGIDHFTAFDSPTLRSGLEQLYASNGCAILEVMTGNCPNDDILKSYFQHLNTITE